MPIYNGIINQKGTPAFFSDIFANRPAFGYAGRVFISTDTGAIYEDTGSAWTLIADAGAGTTGTLQQVTTNGNTTTLAIQVQGIDFSDGAGTGLYNIAIGNQTMGANTTGNNNIGIGYQTLKFNTTGALNVAVGNTALVNNTTGSQNTAVGQLALNLNTTGSQNTALGNATLQNNTTGASNTAIGHASLVANTTASFNTAVGYTSMQLNTTGTNNTALGFNSLNANTTGNNNTALGLSALSGNTTASFNTAIGSSSLLNNTTGDSNTAVGYSALLNNTTGANNVGIGQSSLTANTTGFSNVGIGSRALTANTTGAQNVAIGTDALYINTTGNTNTAIGTAALSLNTTGGGNTAIGVSALNSNTTANFNTAVGGSSLAANTTGANNVGLGYQSLSANTTSNNNTAIGFNSMATNITGAGNTAIGYNSLYLNTTGGNNVAIGNSALISNTTANNNTAIGVSSLTANTTGTQNTAIGINSGVNNTTGSGNNFIGYNSGAGITTGGGNTILGNAGTLSATLSNNVILADGNGNTRLFSDANGLIGINQAVGSVPGGQLDIHTTQTYALVLNGLSTSNAYTAFSNASVGKWRIGNTYNAGANTFDIFNLGTSSNALSFNSTTNGAVFSNSVVIGGGSLVGALLTINRTSNANNNDGIYLVNNGTAGYGSSLYNRGTSGGVTYNYWALQGENSGTGGLFRIQTANTSQVLTTALEIASDTNATFTGNITAGSNGQVFRTGNGGTSSIGMQFINSGGNSFIGLSNSIGTGYLSGTAYAFNIQTESAQDLQFGTNNTNRLIIKSGGNVLIGTATDSGRKLQVFSDNAEFGDTGSFTFYMNVNSGAATGVSWNINGSTRLNILPSGVTTISNLAGTGSRAVLSDANGVLSAPVSDISVKENINTIGYGLNEILKMNPVWFNYNNEYKSFGEGRQNGNIAQEMEIIIPEAVFTTPSTGKMGINYDQLHAVYIKAIQELKAEIDALKNN